MSEEHSVGETLRQRRLEQGFSLDEMEVRTRIRRQFLEALEEERFDSFPAETYLKGFLRNYAEALGFDSNDVSAICRRCAAERPSPKDELRALETELVEPVKRSASMGWLPLFFLLALLAALAAAFYYVNVRTPSSPQRETPAISIEPDREAPSRRPADSGMKLPMESGSPQDRKGEESPGAPILEPVPEKQPQQSTAPEVSLQGTAAVADSDHVQTGALTAVQARIPSGGATIRLAARESTSLEVVIDKRPQQNYMLQVGTTLTWRVRHSARLLLGNPAAVQIWLNGQRLDPGDQSEILLASGKSPEP